MAERSGRQLRVKVPMRGRWLKQQPKQHFQKWKGQESLPGRNRGGGAGFSGVPTHGSRASSSGVGGTSQKGTGKSKSKLERETGERVKTRVEDGRVDSRAESKAGKAGVALGEIGGDCFGDGSASAVTKAKRVKVVDGEKSRVDGSADGGRQFECSAL